VQFTRRGLLARAAGLTGTAVISALLAACKGKKAQQAVGATSTVTATTPIVPPSTAVAVAASPTQPPVRGIAVDKLRFAWWTDVGNLTPFQVSATGPGGAVLMTFVYDTLTWKDDRGIIPLLGSSWEVSPDGTQYTFHLVDIAVWHDGTPLTVDDVAFSYSYFAAHPYVWMSSDVVKSATAGTQGAINFTLVRPAANFLEEIAGIIPIIPKHVWENVSDPTKYTGTDASVGSGPYVMSEHDATAGAYRLTAFDQYWKGQPVAKELQQITTTPQAQLEIVEKGDADLSLGTDASVVDLIFRYPDLKVEMTAPLSVVRLAVNTLQPPLDQRDLRQAIMYALNRAQIAETMTMAPGIITGVGIVPPDTPWFNSAIMEYPYDPDKAKTLLGGKTYAINLLAAPTDRHTDLMKPMLAAVGITLNVQQVDTATRLQHLSDGTFQLALTSHIGIGGDPDYLRRWYAGEEANAFAKGSIFKNAQYAQLAEQQAATLDPTRRRAIVFQMQTILAEELPTLVLYHRRFYWVYDGRVFKPLETWGGLMNGIPFPNNKLTLIGS